MASILKRVASFLTGKKPDAAASPPVEKSPPNSYMRRLSEMGPQARIDAAQTTDENKRHWANADFLGPNASHDPIIQTKLRSRSRYETINNSYLKGLIKTKSNDLIGTGPRPQIILPNDPNGALAKKIEEKFTGWAESVHFPRKLRLLQKEYDRDGGGFIVLRSDDNSVDPVQLYPQMIEADQCFSPYEKFNDPFIIDGVQVDALWKPIGYYFLKHHPGEIRILGTAPAMTSQSFEFIEARNVIHWYPEDRANQQRGIPETTPALPLFAQLRRYSMATLTAAEFAAMLAGVLETTLPPEAGASTVDAWQFFEMVRGSLMSTPAGWKASQFKPEQPATTFAEFERTKLNEAGRSCGAPLNVTTGNSTDYNFSSGRLDHVPYHRGAWIDRDDFRLVVLKPIFSAWATEATQITGYLPAGLPPVAEWKVSWQWDGFAEIDEAKGAQAKQIKLATGQSSLSGVLAEDGEYWRDMVDQLAIEIEYCKSKGVPHPIFSTSAAATAESGLPPDNTNPADTKPKMPAPPSRIPMPSRNGHYAGAGHE